MTIDIQHDENPAYRLTAAEARAVTARLQEALGEVWRLLLEAYQGRAHEVLGYESWAEYCSAEFATDRLRLPRDERREAVAAMRDEGMSVREVAAALGVNKETVVHDGQVYGNRTSPTPEPTAPDPEPDKETPDMPAPRRPPLPRSFDSAALELWKITTRITKLTKDDRFPDYAETIHAANLADLTRCRDALDTAIQTIERR